MVVLDDLDPIEALTRGVWRLQEVVFVFVLTVLDLLEVIFVLILVLDVPP